MNSTLKAIGRPALRFYRRAIAQFSRWQPQRSADQLHAFWRQPDAGNLPADYLAEGHERSAFLVKLLLRYGSVTDSVLEVGCNAGRNLEHLRRAGFRNLNGIEINPAALALLRTELADLANLATLHEGAAEKLLARLGQYDIVYTMAVLEHIHGGNGDSIVFPHIARIARKLVVTIEDEYVRSWRHFPRNYAKVFGALDLKQIDEIVAPPGCPEGFVARVFTR